MASPPPLERMSGLLASLPASPFSFRMNDEARTLLTGLGSSYASKLAFRDNWIFIGAKGLQVKSPYEQVFSPLP